jgi:endonuclease G
MVRHSKRSARSRFSPGKWFLQVNLGLALLLGGWYWFQPEARQHEVRHLVENAFAHNKRVSVVDVAWDVWQLYYADSATGKIAIGDKTFVYGGGPVFTGSAAATPQRVLTNRGYVCGYNDATGNPAWVAYHLRDMGTLPPATPRPDKFEVDRRTVARIVPEDYANTGYDRGHLAPNYAIATRFGEAAQRETFLMSNITPQRHALNAGVWKELEMKIATSYPARYGEVWVFAGPIFGPHPDKLRGGVLVPEAFYMIIVDEQEGKLRTLALLVPQQASSAKETNTYITTVDEIERRTQLDFFRELDDPSEAEIAQQRAGRVW